MQYKKEVGVMLDVAQSYVKSKISTSVVDNADATGSNNQETILTYTNTV